MGPASQLDGSCLHVTKIISITTKTKGEPYLLYFLFNLVETLIFGQQFLMSHGV